MVISRQDSKTTMALFDNTFCFTDTLLNLFCSFDPDQI